ncbi:17905_t:CDS:2, partial [Gigaspora rosea]
YNFFPFFQNWMDKDRNGYYGYFEQKLSKWDIIEFLKQCDLEPYGKKREGLRERKVVSYTESSTDIDISSDSNCEESRNSTTDNDEVESDYDFSNFELAYRALGPSKMSMYSLWRREDDFTSTSKLEGWFEIIIWTHLVDFAFRKMETDLVRGEGILLNKRLEFGAIEAERNGEVTKGTKLLAYSLKMSKMLKDMINVLATECNMKEDVLRKLQIAGISPRSEYDANNYHRSSDGICYSHPSSKIL